MNYTLKKTETGRKNGKFLYEVIDESGNVISSRTSNRDYVACTVNGGFYFGRLDLIGKGDHNRKLKHHFEQMNIDESLFNESGLNNFHSSLEAYKSMHKSIHFSLNLIAYLK